MIPAAFAYERATAVAGALEILARQRSHAAVLAGGHSLLPRMKLRLARPEVVVDIGPCVGELGHVRVDGDEVVLGALVTHHELAGSGLVAGQVPILAHAAGLVGDPQVRRRGTLGGSLAHADPAGDLPGVIVALGATMVVRGPGGCRLVAAADFFVGSLRTALAPDELLVEVRVPAVAGAGWSYQRVTRRSGDWPTVAVAVVAHPACGVALVNMGRTPRRAASVEAALG
ncbi:MAG: FAD binding domain-containing protein, partial [Acidimicrobiales bacterium]